MTRHELKLWTDQFIAMKSGAKRADVRRCDDRKFRRGDECLYRDFQAKTGKYSGDAILARITHLTRAAGHLDLYGAQNAGQTDDGLSFPIAVLSIEVLEIGKYEVLKRTAPLGDVNQAIAASAKMAIDPTTPDSYVHEPCGHRSPGSVYFCDLERNHTGEHFHGGRIAGPRDLRGGRP